MTQHNVVYLVVSANSVAQCQEALRNALTACNTSSRFSLRAEILYRGVQTYSCWILKTSGVGMYRLEAKLALKLSLAEGIRIGKIDMCVANDDRQDVAINGYAHLIGDFIATHYRMITL